MQIFNTTLNNLQVNLGSDAAPAWTDVGVSTSAGYQVRPGNTIIYGYGFYPTSVVNGMRVINSSVVGEANPRYYMDANGMTWWGPGGAVAVDTNLYRLSAGVLKTDGGIQNVTDVIARVNSASQVNIGDDGSGRPSIRFGPVVDTNLYRTSQGVLKTDGSFQTVGLHYAAWNGASYGVVLGGGPNLNSLLFANDTNLYRSVAGLLVTDGEFHARQGGAGQVNIAANSSTPYITFGSAQDTNLFRGGVGALQTSGTFVANQLYSQDGGLVFNPSTPTGNGLYFAPSGETQPRFSIDYGGVIHWGPGGATVPDTNLYRLSAGVLKTDGQLQASFFNANQVPTAASNAFLMSVSGDTVNRLLIQADGKHLWSSGAALADTNLYRYGASQLATDSDFRINTATAGHGLHIQKSGQAFEQILAQVDGGGAGLPRIAFGTGAAAQDIWITRYQPGSLSIGDFAGRAVLSIGFSTNTGFAGNNGDIGLAIANTSNLPGTPVNGGVLYVAAGNLTYKGPSGSVTTIAPA